MLLLYVSEITQVNESQVKQMKVAERRKIILLCTSACLSLIESLNKLKNLMKKYGRTLDKLFCTLTMFVNNFFTKYNKRKMFFVGLIFKENIYMQHKTNI